LSGVFCGVFVRRFSDEQQHWRYYWIASKEQRLISFALDLGTHVRNTGNIRRQVVKAVMACCEFTISEQARL
jgi:hypothetical protein